MVRTHGMSHVALAVRDVQRAFAFYRELVGAVAIYEDADSIQAQTPGSRDVLVFERGARKAGKAGGIAHFGFRLVEPTHMDVGSAGGRRERPRPAGIAAALRELDRLGATIVDQGEFCPGNPYVFFRDPDGYEVEIWYESPTPVDPPAPGRRAVRARHD